MALDDNATASGFEMDLGKLEPLAWDLLEHGAKSGRDAFHSGTFSTLSHDGFPASRTMVIRQVDAAHRLLAAFTDRRAPKVAALDEHPRASWVFYDPRRRLEIRAAGTVTLHVGTDAMSETLWRTNGLGMKLAYAGTVPMGQRLAAAPVESAPGASVAAPATDDSEPGFDNFAVLLTRVQRLEILHLHHAGHRRARFIYDGKELVDSYWIAT